MYKFGKKYNIVVISSALVSHYESIHYQQILFLPYITCMMCAVLIVYTPRCCVTFTVYVVLMVYFILIPSSVFNSHYLWYIVLSFLIIYFLLTFYYVFPSHSLLCISFSLLIMYFLLTP